MADHTLPPDLPDLRAGVRLSDLEPGRLLLGRVDAEPAFLVRAGEEVHAVGAVCTHYGAPLWEGLVVGDEVRCPWHHACFALRTGEALAPPALDPLPRWHVAVHDGTVVVGRRIDHDGPAGTPLPTTPRSVVIVGAGAAGIAAARTLRGDGYTGPVALVDPDPDAPYDRPNLSKDFLAGTAPEAWLPLGSPDDLAARGIRRVFQTAVGIDGDGPIVHLSSGEGLEYDALLLAPGSRPHRLRVPGDHLPHVVSLRSLEDCRRLIDAARDAREVVVVGAGFIGMEAAAALRTRNLGVTVVAPDPVPFRRVLGNDLGRYVRRLQVEHDVRFRLGRSVSEIEPERVTLDDGSRISADVVLVAVGVTPNTRLAEARGLRVDDGILVDAHMATSEPAIWAAGDAVRFPHPRTGRPIRVEHWVVAERQGRIAARNMVGLRERFQTPPFFWTQLYDTSLAYVGHADGWEEIRVEGDVDGGDAMVRYLKGGETVAVATVGRERASLEAELDLQRRWSSSRVPEGDTP